MHNAPKTFVEHFARELTTNKDIIKTIYQFEFHAPELNFIAQAMNILACKIGTLDDMILHYLELEFETKKNNALRQNTVATKVLDNFIEDNSKNFMKMVLKEPIAAVLSGNTLEEMEINKNKILVALQVADGKKVTKKRVDDLKPLSKMYGRVYKKVKENAEKLNIAIQLFADYIFTDDSTNLFPFQLKVICTYIYNRAVKLDIDPLPRVGALVILRMFNPAILFPNKKKITKKKVTGDQRRGMMLITKAIQQLSNRTTSNEKAMVHVKETLEALQEKCDKFLKSLILTPEQIEEKKKEYLSLLQMLNEDQKILREVTLFLYNFFLQKKIPLADHLPEVIGEGGEVLKYGRIAYCSVYKIKNPKKKRKRSTNFSYCHVDYSKEEKNFSKFIKNLFKDILKKNQTFKDKVYVDNPECKEMGIKVFCFYSSYKFTYFFAIVKGEMCHFMVNNFLRQLSDEFIGKSFKATIEMIHENVLDYNLGKRYSPKDLVPHLNLYILSKGEEEGLEEEEEEGDEEMEFSGNRSLFKHLPDYAQVVGRFKKKKGSGRKKMLGGFDSRSVREEW